MHIINNNTKCIFHYKSMYIETVKYISNLVGKRGKYVSYLYYNMWNSYTLRFINFVYPNVYLMKIVDVGQIYENNVNQIMKMILSCLILIFSIIIAHCLDRNINCIHK